MNLSNNITISYDPLLMLKVNKISSRNFETVADIFKRADYFKNGGVHYTKRVVTICINGAWLPFKQWATRLVMPNDNVLVNVMPFAGGGDDEGGKNFLRIIAQIAVVAAAYFLAPIAAGALGFTAGTAAYATATAVASAGIMFVGQLAVNALLPMQNTQVSQQEKDNVYSLTAQGNRARIGGALPQVYGNLKDFPSFCSQPYWHFDDNEQELFHWMMVTTGDAELSDFKLGDSKLGNFKGAEVFVFNKQRHRYVADGNGGLAHTLLSDLENGDEHHLNAGVVPAHNNVWTSPEVTGGIELVAPNKLENGHSGWFGGFAVNPPDTYLKKIEIDFLFPRGLSNNGEVEDDIDVFIDVEYRLINDHGVAIDILGAADNTWYNLELTSALVSLSGASAESLRVTKTYITPGVVDWQNRRIEIRAKRVSDAADDNKIADQVNWIGLRGFLGNFKYRDDQTIVCLKLKAAKEISSSSTRNFNCIAQTKLNALSITGINDVELAALTAVTRKPADIIFDALAQMICPDENDLDQKLAKVLTLVDLPTLVRVSEAAIAEGANLDIKVDNKKPFWQWLEQFCLCMHVKPYLCGTQISFWRDQERDAPSFGVTPLPVGERTRYSLNQFHLVENGMSAKIDFKHVGDLYEGFEVRFLNRATWRPDFVRMGVDGEINVPVGKKPMVINADGITDIAQARALGQHLARAQEYRNMTVSITTELTGKLVDYGNVLHLPDGIVSEVDTLEITSHEGDVVVFDGDIRNASVNKIVFSHKQARASQVVDCVVLDACSVKLLAVPKIDDVAIDLNPTDSGGQYSASLYDVIDGAPLDVIVRGVTPKGNNKVQLDAVIDDARVWA